MNLTAKVSGIPGAAPFGSLLGAWHWSPNPRFNFFAALDRDGEHLLQVNVVDACDHDLVRALLEFAREHAAEVIAVGRPLTLLEGFRHPGHDFDGVAIAAPGIHGYLAREFPDLHSVAYAVFPGCHSEFSGTESEEEAQERVRKMLRTTELDRDPVPFLKIRYENTRTKSKSTGLDRGLATLPVLLQELQLLQDAPGSFVEWENRHGDIWRAQWDDGLRLHGPSVADRPTDPNALLPFAEQTITGDYRPS
ncbi:hypothetical protein SSP35_02_02950 [Streptomyces sp. NBRC 110611]|uniref:hypothetical protein n=1 Tax=Streptomyces sp. NBRC 110611 TaxID=1621259 RepID=UPI00085527CB|nr:hypothetical protein [Streptomyces sp. NBRC 110611]GAU65926.1 hypothetical protein SSP35_02_02950 [Streptomyces sp. NBRC 110611]